MDSFAKIGSFLQDNKPLSAVFLIIAWRSPALVHAVSDYRSARIDDKIVLHNLKKELPKQAEEVKRNRKGML
ncbi:MAG: hypothetical protein DU429_04215 [Candidatus Tokpelaia sp.]|uniref:hypothetical protein n=1 Tax=Candidatus Tokpelaia sp. TaxID=2233777 RepID=UPI00123AC2EC|nr:hypothetical protein [Candidatus Tokpelaia sp.]KAA6204964.1 MAG: hypothetical protein DU430_06160 [Candidatus Tokpelaia sp.]KAA6207054.1 MAG: hypothetical protein DU429_04215 [Candidatus Tokpelaia sp.]KAA6405406.1 hypothetical protein DPQ22_04925 [Candidatus Tokpelaia sp.]